MTIYGKISPKFQHRHTALCRYNQYKGNSVVPCLYFETKKPDGTEQCDSERMSLNPQCVMKLMEKEYSILPVNLHLVKILPKSTPVSRSFLL